MHLPQALYASQDPQLSSYIYTHGLTSDFSLWPMHSPLSPQALHAFKIILDALCLFHAPTH